MPRVREMHIQVSDVLARDTGYRTTFTIAGERPDLEDVTLTSDVEGSVEVMRVETGLHIRGRVSTSIELECHRCLRAFAYPLTVELSAEFTVKPAPDQWPIVDDQFIDLAPVLRQELIVSQPIKQLCKPDCLGLCEACGEPQDKPHKH